LIILEELGMNYELELLSFEKLIAPEFKKINPNGKVPGKPLAPQLESQAAEMVISSYV
jgi:hypothetical protein